MNRTFYYAWLWLLLASLLSNSLRAAEPAAIDFERDVKPILTAHCVKCHGPEKQQGGLRLDQRGAALAGGDSGKALVPGKVKDSLVVDRISSSDKDERMPQEGKPLTEAEIVVLKTWIEQGATWPADTEKTDKPHWAYQPVKRSALPAVKDAKWPRNAIDYFILARLEEAKLNASPEADRRTLLRRLKFDLLGLPPTPQEIDAFVNDKSTDAYEQLVERLLASPHYGERWARHWLDVVRFAESNGFETNQPRANAWPYRDYVIAAFNDDLSYFDFVQQQLSGDTTGNDAATGFLVAGAWDEVKSPDPTLTLQQRADELHDMVATTGSAFLGLTVGCARCHNHKFDPISQVDYHAMKAVFAGVQHGERPLRPRENLQRQRDAAKATQELARVEQQLRQLTPLAQPLATVWLDDTSAAAKSLIAPAGTQAYQPGATRGQAQDRGDVARLPNVGREYTYWRDVAKKDVMLWQPKVEGKFRVWLSWGSGWHTHATDAQYLVDRDGDLTTRDDQQPLATVDQRRFADATGDMPGQPLWSGLRDAGVQELSPKSVVVLRGGATEAVVSADLLVLQAESKLESKLPALRATVQTGENSERFPPQTARWVRFTILEANGSEPCIDELEIFTAGDKSENVALAAKGAKVKSSGDYPGNPIHRLEHVNDGQYGNERSWISGTPGSGTLEIELDQPYTIDRVLWSRDRSPSPRYQDRRATKYRIEIASTPNEWTVVASSDDRVPLSYNLPDLATSAGLNAEQQATYARLLDERSRWSRQLAVTTVSMNAYAGRFANPEPIKRLHRGDPMQPREAVAPASLASFGEKWQLPDNAPEQQRRATLAKWIADPANPLTARVAVNRLWQHHFGRGIVATPSDFGRNGIPPTHPELLDYLASELLQQKGSLKQLHRLIVLSNTYRQSSQSQAAGMATDAGARLLWRYPPRRLEAEPLRDAILAVSGNLNIRAGGPGFDLFEPNGNYVKVYNPKQVFGPEEWRRMVYQYKPRMQLDSTFGAFDCPDGGQIAPARHSSTTPLQALNLLNSPFLIQQADIFAARVKSEAGEDRAAQVRQTFRLAVGRDPSASEASGAAALIQEHGLAALCRALFNSNEFVFVQ